MIHFVVQILHWENDADFAIVLEFRDPHMSFGKQE